MEEQITKTVIGKSTLFLRAQMEFAETVCSKQQKKMQNLNQQWVHAYIAGTVTYLFMHESKKMEVTERVKKETFTALLISQFENFFPSLGESIAKSFHKNIDDVDSSIAFELAISNLEHNHTVLNAGLSKFLRN